MSDLNNVIKLNPLTKFCMTIGNIPSSYLISMTYEEQLLWLCDYLKNTVIPAINNNADSVTELQNLYIQLKNYVDNYFDNLDVQEEINNKLDEMVESGTFQEIITAYLQVQGILAYDTVTLMKQATNLKEGSFAETYGFYSINDGGNAKYKIRELQEGETADEITLITLENNFVAELIKQPIMSVKIFGAKGDNLTDDTSSFKKAIEFCSSNKIELLIPEGTFILNTLTEETESYNYKYLIKLLNNTKITGINRNSIIKTTLTDNYTSVFLNNTSISNIQIKNLTIEQNYLFGNNMSFADRGNLKNAISFYGIVSNVTIENVFFKNCCGADVISFNNSLSSNIQIKNNEFDYHYVRNIAYYDRSIIYMECNNYFVNNNILNGNFETLGGIECHGYNGICSENMIDKCEVAIHIAPRYTDDIFSANINVNNNIGKDNAVGVEIWYNTNPNATKGCSGINISNNIFKTSGYVLAQNFFKSGGLVPPAFVSGIVPAPTDSNKYFSDITIDSNILSLKEYDNYKSYTDKSTLYQYAGISLSGRSDVENLHITNNTIEGFASNGIAIGDIRYSSNSYSKLTNCEITGNTIINCGYGVYNENSFKACILIARGIMENVIIRNNIINKTDNEYTLPYAILNQGGTNTEKTNVYCINNIITSVGEATETRIVNSSGHYTLITDRGDTTNRPTTANVGDIYFDTTLGKPLWWDGSNWVDSSGSSIS